MKAGGLLLVPIVDELGGSHASSYCASAVGSGCLDATWSAATPHVQCHSEERSNKESQLSRCAMKAQTRETSKRETSKPYFLGATVSPNTEICPWPATLSPVTSSGFGRYNVLQCSHRYTSASLPQAFSTSPQACSFTSSM